MATRTTYVDEHIALQPAWLQKKWGRGWATAFGLTKEALRDSFERATLARMTRHAPDDALPYRGQDVTIERGQAESIDTYRERLAKPFSAWEWSGTDKGVIDQLTAIGFPAHIKRNNQWHWDVHDGNPLSGGWWARMWPIVQAPAHWLPPPRIGDPGITIGDGSTLIGVRGATVQEVEQVRRIVKTWSSSQVFIPKIIMLIGGAIVIGDGAIIGSGPAIGTGAVAYLAGW